MKRFSFSLLAGFLAILGAGAQTFDAAKCYTVATPEGLVLDAQSSVQTETTIVLATPEADNANGAEEHPVIQPGQTYGYKFRIQGPSNVSH